MIENIVILLVILWVLGCIGGAVAWMFGMSLSQIEKPETPRADQPVTKEEIIRTAVLVGIVVIIALLSSHFSY